MKFKSYAQWPSKEPVEVEGEAAEAIDSVLAGSTGALRLNKKQRALEHWRHFHKCAIEEVEGATYHIPVLTAFPVMDEMNSLIKRLYLLSQGSEEFWKELEQLMLDAITFCEQEKA